MNAIRWRAYIGTYVVLGTLVVGALPFAVQAQSNDANDVLQIKLSAQIASILEQLTAFNKQLARGTVAGASTCTNLSRTLIRGSRGEEVACLQRFLISQNLLSADSSTGYFGSVTEAAVKKFQLRDGVVSSPQAAGYGTVGRKTRAAIAIYASGVAGVPNSPLSPGVADASLPNSPPVVSNIGSGQTGVKEIGNSQRLVGVIDYVWGLDSHRTDTREQFRTYFRSLKSTYGVNLVVLQLFPFSSATVSARQIYPNFTDEGFDATMRYLQAARDEDLKVYINVATNCVTTDATYKDTIRLIDPNVTVLGDGLWWPPCTSDRSAATQNEPSFAWQSGVFFYNVISTIEARAKALGILDTIAVWQPVGNNQYGGAETRPDVDDFVPELKDFARVGWPRYGKAASAKAGTLYDPQRPLASVATFAYPLLQINGTIVNGCSKTNCGAQHAFQNLKTMYSTADAPRPIDYLQVTYMHTSDVAELMKAADSFGIPHSHIVLSDLGHEPNAEGVARAVETINPQVITLAIYAGAWSPDGYVPVVPTETYKSMVSYFLNRSVGASCTINNKTIPSGFFTTAYKTTAEAGKCASEQRVCVNGNLSGSYTYSSCPLGVSGGETAGTVPSFTLSPLTSPGTMWNVQGVGDADNDGKSDLVWQNNDGTPAIWFMDGTTVRSTPGLSNPGTEWKIKGVGDFDGDGKRDLVWQHTDGTPAIWFMDGTTVRSTPGLSNPGAAWKIKGVGDFDHDNKSDIIFQNDSGQAAIWFMDGATVRSSPGLTPILGSAWSIKAVADLNADGKSDLVWQNTDGTPVVWLMNGSSVVENTPIGGNPGSSWTIVGARDFDADGKADVVWQNNTTGQAAIWFMNGTQVLKTPGIVANPGATWRIKGVGDFNKDGRADILWNDSVTGGIFIGIQS